LDVKRSFFRLDALEFRTEDKSQGILPG
jgi:hypothetical protein